MTTDLISRHVPGYGYLPILEQDGREVYRGEFQATPQEAITKAEAAMVRFQEKAA